MAFRLLGRLLVLFLICFRFTRALIGQFSISGIRCLFCFCFIATASPSFPIMGREYQINLVTEKWGAQWSDKQPVSAKESVFFFAAEGRERFHFNLGQVSTKRIGLGSKTFIGWRQTCLCLWNLRECDSLFRHWSRIASLPIVSMIVPSLVLLRIILWSSLCVLGSIVCFRFCTPGYKDWRVLSPLVPLHNFSYWLLAERLAFRLERKLMWKDSCALFWLLLAVFTVDFSLW
jgi:hypothetical protein